ncbi:MAG TPA: hypothetical protein VGE31_02980 [Candidatus Paceibacterota bacterium]
MEFLANTFQNSFQALERLFFPAPPLIAPNGIDVKPFLTPADYALREIERRRHNPALMAKVAEYLNNDIPAHFKQTKPIFYFSRHIATPNYETLRFIEVTKDYGCPLVIGQDTKDKFVSNNSLKRTLAKMPITVGITRSGDEIIEYVTIVDFQQNQGRPMQEVETFNGTRLAALHERLLREIYPKEVQIVDESSWIDRHHRGDLYKHYVDFLSLLVVHGIMVEDYIPEDYQFINDILLPAIEEVEAKFGVKPLIVPLIPEEMSLEKNWLAYPSVLYPILKEEFKK